MNRKTFFFTTLFSSLLGGVLAIWLFLQWGPQPTPRFQGVTNSTPVQMSRLLSDSNFIVPEGINFVVAAEQSTPAVVHIRSSFEQESGGRGLGNLFQNDNSRGYQGPAERATGSGVIISEDGYIITNHHVVEDARDIEITLWNDQRFQAELIGLDPTTDLALVKVEGEGFPFLSFGDSDKVQIGEWVLAVGNPFDLTSTVTAGIVSAKARNINILGGGATIESFIQTDAAVNPGNSGGALVNLRGELVGVNTAIASRTGSYVGYSFAVPANLARKVAEDLKAYGEVQRALLGVRIINVSDLVNTNLGVNNGVYINSVTIGSAAADAGLQEGDVIIKIDGKSIRTVAELQERVGRNRPGDAVAVTYLRNGEELETDAVLKNSMGTTETVATTESFSSGGATFANLSSLDMAEYNVRGGAKVIDVQPGAWEEAGIEPGFVITSIEKRAIASVDDLQQLLVGLSGERIIVLGYEPDGTKAYYMMDLE